MKYHKIILVVLFCSIWSIINCNGQNTNQIVGGPCQGCEALFEYGTKRLTTIDTLPDFAKAKLKLKLTGIVFEKDGKTPAKNVILYIYHTTRQGIYARKSDAKGWARRHGYLRGWVKTDETGRYTFYTFRPSAYPDRSEPEHIHLTVKEPSKNEYYMDGFVFDDDPLLTVKERKSLENRGGSGIVKSTLEHGITTYKRDIILGAHIPNYE
jgi:protocatechuate 3,4-dioxygenase beta subunit